MTAGTKIRTIIFKTIVWLGYGLFMGCNGGQGQLEAVLQYSGSNRKELEKVLEHYSRQAADSLKLKAAVFLIENMPGHYTYSGPFLDNYYARLDTVGRTPWHEKKIFQTIPFERYEYQKYLSVQEDVKCIQANFLIHQIELAFRQWETCPWLEGTDFETFREYLLPYRVENEPLDYWRDSIEYFKANLQYYCEYYEDCRYSVSSMRNKFHGYIPDIEKKIPEARLKDFKMECIPTSKLGMFIYRIIGIPAAIDYIPHFANRNGRHYWTIEIDPDVDPFQVYQANIYRAAKIYRRTFSHQPTATPRRGEYVPPFFLDPFNKDVTSLYIPTTDISLRIPREVKTRHAYLAVFNDLTWKPIACAEVSERKACFLNMGKDVVYLPVYYDEKDMLPLASPFIVFADGRIHTLALRTDSVQSMTLKRKYPSGSEHDYWFSELHNAYIEASNRTDFAQSDTIFHFPSKTPGEYGYIVPDTTQQKRYWRFVSPRSWGVDLADLHFYDCHNQEIQGRIMQMKPEEGEALFDSSPLTYTTVRSWIGLDFGRPVSISRIRYLPRNDANGIYPGNEYELFYYRFPEGWISLGIKSPEGYELEYEQVPAGTLYWLRNLTEGQEERIFTWENGKARFW